MEIIFWLFIFLILYCYFGYPLILLILGILFGKKPEKKEIFPLVSLLIPVYNEEKVIQKKIENSLELDYPKDKLEIIVASESNDRTNEIVKSYEDKGVKLFAYSGREGKQYTIYRTIPHCKGEIIVLTDANGIFEKDALKKLVRNFADKRIGCVSGLLKYINPSKGSVGETEGVYWKYETFIKKLESNLFSLLGANGSIYAIKKELYKPISPYRGDDFDLPIRVILQGYGVIFEPEAVSKEEVYSTALANFKRKVVIAGWHFRGALILLKESIKKFKPVLFFELISHKILRWLTGYFLIFIFLVNLFLLKNPFYLLLFILQLIFYSLAFLGYLTEKKGKVPNKLVNLIYYFCLVNLAAIIGVARGILGKQKPIWEKVR
jgi:cellulose synthase/poly-beta-1,6-N-acetylglucosamine synthase-like glycosyltransferase